MMWCLTSPKNWHRRADQLTMKKRFIKNLYHIMEFVIGDLIIAVPLIGACFLNRWQSKEVIILIFSLFASLIMFECLIGFYWAFQIVVVDDWGLTVLLCGKKIRQIPWERIKTIKKKTIMRVPCLTFVTTIPNRGFVDCYMELNLDYRKKIIKSILHHAPTDIKDILMAKVAI